MPILYPGAVYRPLGPQSAASLSNPEVVCLHTMAGTLNGTDTLFRLNGYSGTESHFGVGADGTVYQWQDLAYQADANLDGNHRIISIETEDNGPGFPAWTGSDVPAWTEQQLTALSLLVSWLCAEFTIPVELIPDSRPERRGVGFHRQGVDPWRAVGGELWSSSRSKVCPGDRRITQIPEIIKRAKKAEPMATPEEVWSHPVEDKYRPGNTMRTVDALAWSAKHGADIQDRLDRIEAKLDAWLAKWDER